MLTRLADWLILEPTRDSIPADEKTRREISFGAAHVEAWCQTAGNGQAELFVLKFPGAGGRAERASLHPLDYWDDLAGQMWAVNPPGYGGSPGRAEVRSLGGVARVTYDAVREAADGRPIVVTGNSLGCCTALLVAATLPVAGVILRNPVPIRPLIVGRFGWWNFGLGARLIAANTPDELDAVNNAARCGAPAVFIHSQRDRVVPTRYQRLVHDAYAGPMRIVALPEADHATPMTEAEQIGYAKQLDWLRGQMGL